MCARPCILGQEVNRAIFVKIANCGRLGCVCGNKKTIRKTEKPRIDQDDETARVWERRLHLFDGSQVIPRSMNFLLATTMYFSVISTGGYCLQRCYSASIEISTRAVLALGSRPISLAG